MRFLVKRDDSAVLAEALTYRKGAHNDRLLQLLVDEQRGYCAYTEKQIERLDTAAVEHFDARLKDRDDHFTYYAVLQWANQRKRRREREYVDAGFFRSRFFQRPEARARVTYDATGNEFLPVDPADADVQELLDFLGFNDEVLVEERRKHVARLQDLFDCAGWGPDQRRAWLRDTPRHQHYPSALEAAFGFTLP